MNESGNENFDWLAEQIVNDLTKSALKLGDLPAGSEEREREAKIYKILADAYISTVNMSNEMSVEESKRDLETARYENELEDKIAQRKNDMKMLMVRISADFILMAIPLAIGRICYKEGQKFEEDGTYSSFWTKQSATKMADLIRPKR